MLPAPARWRSESIPRISSRITSYNVCYTKLLRAGAGSIADVSQTESRLARAKGSLAETRSTLKAAEANYQRVVGKLAGDVQYFTPQPTLLPKSHDEAVEAVTTGNPKVRALEYNVSEAQARKELSDSNFLPKINLELSSTYQDQVESSVTYEHNNQRNNFV